MTEFWVSHGNKWCDFCKIYIANTPANIRGHDFARRHRDNVVKRLASARKQSTAKDVHERALARELRQIEERARRSYQKDLASFNVAANKSRSARPSRVRLSAGDGWEYDAASGYYYNLPKGVYFDSNSGMFYSNASGRWAEEEEALGTPSPRPSPQCRGAASSIAASKRKREERKTEVVSEEEAEALEAREAAKRRVAEREKPFLGLYSSYCLFVQQQQIVVRTEQEVVFTAS